MPRILHIETSGKTCSVAISKADSLTDYNTISEDKSHARHLTIMIQGLLHHNKLVPEDLDAVAVSAGPGSYTGLRIGVSVTKGMCYAAGLPLIAVPTPEIMLKHLFNSYDKTSDFDLFVPMIDARRMEVYQACYTSDGKRISDVSPLILDANAYRDQLEKHKMLFFGNGAEKAEKVITHPHAFFIPGVMPDARYMIPGALKRFRHKNFEDVAYYEPFYLKSFQATTPKNLLFYFCIMNKSYYIETFGCQMNIADSEVVAAVLNDAGYSRAQHPEAADLILLNTCAVRDNAEQRVWNKLQHFKGLKKKHTSLKIGILGCMAQRVGNGFEQNKTVDFIAGPDSYRKLPELIQQSSTEHFASELELSRTETYDKVLPRRLDTTAISGFVSITRGCNNFCSYCIVPYTRGRERSRNPGDVLNEINDLQQKGYKEITLLGQNVNSYRWEHDGQCTGFPELLQTVATQFPKLRIRFTTSHPKDISDALIETMAAHKNICNHIHLPVQSGSNNVLKAMNRGYTREWYLDRIHKIKTEIPGCGLSTDVFAGFPGETEADHKASMSLMQQVKFESAFMFRYSERPGTYAAKHLKDDVPEETKIRRLNELIRLQHQLSLESNKHETGKIYDILIEGKSKRSDKDVFGRTETNKLVIVPDSNYKPGNIIKVIIESYTSATLFGKTIGAI